MNKTELIKAVSEKTYYSQALVKEILYSAQDIIIETVANGEDVRLSGLGKFTLRKRAARKYVGFDGKTRKRKESVSPCFVVWEGFKDKVRKVYKNKERHFRPFMKWYGK